jgi:8-hydroxy-5-deazaflavin:NADPH oxidoreductase
VFVWRKERAKGEDVVKTVRRIGIIGNGNVGSALERGLRRVGHDVRSVGNDPTAVRDTAFWAEIIMLAVPFGAVDAAVSELGGGAAGKVLVDVTNVLGPQMQLAIGLTTSGAEELQRKIPTARVVKAFNTVFARQMDTGRAGQEVLTLFAAGDDAAAKDEIMSLAREIGFDPVDAGPLQNARLLEPLAVLNIQLAYGLKMGDQIGFRLVRP